jgi:hypothetical protein
MRENCHAPSLPSYLFIPKQNDDIVIAMGNEELSSFQKRRVKLNHRNYLLKVSIMLIVALH